MHTSRPSVFTTAAAEFRERFGTRLQLRERFLRGQSGAFVGVVDCEGRRHNGLFVLKIDAVPTGWTAEPQRHAEALAAGAFGGAVPAIVETFTINGRYVLLLDLAGSRLSWQPLANAPPLMPSAYAQLARTLWTPRLGTLSAIEPAAGLIARRALGYRLDPAAGGRIVSNALTYLPRNFLSESHFLHAGRVLPNPLHFVLHHDEYKTPALRVLRVPVHGDCHPGNVFITENHAGEVDDLKLIDLAAYERDGTAFFDHAYFELSVLLQEMPGIDEPRWLTIVSALASARAFGTAPLSLNGVHQLGKAWMTDIGRGRIAATRLASESAAFRARADDLQLQFLLAQVAAGLAFLNKRHRPARDRLSVTRETYVRSLVWAAGNLEEFMTVSGSISPPPPDTVRRLSL